MPPVLSEHLVQVKPRLAENPSLQIEQSAKRKCDQGNQEWRCKAVKVDIRQERKMPSLPSMAWEALLKAHHLIQHDYNFCSPPEIASTYAETPTIFLFISNSVQNVPNEEIILPVVPSQLPLSFNSPSQD